MRFWSIKITDLSVSKVRSIWKSAITSKFADIIVVECVTLFQSRLMKLVRRRINDTNKSNTIITPSHVRNNQTLVQTGCKLAPNWLKGASVCFQTNYLSVHPRDWNILAFTIHVFQTSILQMEHTKPVLRYVRQPCFFAYIITMLSLLGNHPTLKYTQISPKLFAQNHATLNRH